MAIIFVHQYSYIGYEYVYWLYLNFIHQSAVNYEATWGATTLDLCNMQSISADSNTWTHQTHSKGHFHHWAVNIISSISHSQIDWKIEAFPATVVDIPSNLVEFLCCEYKSNKEPTVSKQFENTPQIFQANALHSNYPYWFLAALWHLFNSAELMATR